MTEGALATKYKNIYFNRDKLIKDVKESWKIEVWDIKDESCVVIFMEAIRNVVKEEMEIWPYTNELQELNRAFWQTIVHELRHTMQDNPLFENKYEAMSREEREKDAENYCREIFENIVVCYDYCVIS
jgi:hypothetical protein